MTSAAFESAKNRMCIRFRKKFVICSYDLRFCVAILCVVVGRWSHRASLAKIKWVLKRKTLGHQMMHGKPIWKPGIGEKAKASRGNAKSGVYDAPYEPPAAKGQLLVSFQW